MASWPPPIQSVPSGQVGAARARGMTGGQVMRLVVLPQAFRSMVPALLTQSVILFQDTSLVTPSSAPGAGPAVPLQDPRALNGGSPAPRGGEVSRIAPREVG